MAYSARVLNHYENPRNVGTLDKSDPSVGTGMVGAPACGDVMRLQIKVGEDGVIEDAKFKTYGCLTSNAPIATPTGYQNVADLKIGESVLAWNGQAIVKNTIKSIFTSQVHYRDLIQLKVDKNCEGKTIPPYRESATIICTKHHVWWLADNRPIEAIDLRPGMELLHMTENEFLSVQSGQAIHQNNWLSPTGVKKHSFEPTNYLTKKAFIEWFDMHQIDVRYVGDGDFWVDTNDGNRLNPTFKVNGQQKLIEIYTHSLPNPTMNRESPHWLIERKQQFAQAGFDCMFLNTAELPYCLPEVQRFIHNGMTIVEVDAITDMQLLQGIQRQGEWVTVYDLQLHEGANIYFVDQVMSHNCGSAIASSSLLTEWVKGKTLEEAAQIKNAQIAEELALPPVKIHCSVLAEAAIKAAIKDYEEKSNKVTTTDSLPQAEPAAAHS